MIHVNRALFSPELLEAYTAYMTTLFDMYGRPNSDAPIRVRIEHPTLGNRKRLPWWDDAMADCFTDHSGEQAIRAVG